MIGRRFAVLLACAVQCLVLGGCFGTPTPLAPAVTGSVGMPHSGVQTDPVELPGKGEGFVRFRPRSPNYWGNPRLIRAIMHASASVSRRLPGAPLVVGDFSARRGGKILGHRSHRTGRDVDLLFYVTTPTGASIRSPGFVLFDADGLARVHDTGAYVRLDVERQWLLIKELLSSEDIGVQFMFVSRDIEALIIDYARARNENPELVWHAETVLLQPGDSAPHDDHIHLRVACTPEESVLGCEGGGPLWEWLPSEISLGPLDPEQLDRIAAEDPPVLEPMMAVTETATDTEPPESAAASTPGGGA
jgi:penicillin-insensitive murein endopeptidase